jgi:nifR3 family TIM-barrel protein
VQKVTKALAGAYLHRDLNAVTATIKAVVEAVKIPVSIKMRIGWDSNSINYLEMAKIAEDNGVKIITLHPRTRSMMFTGKADWQHIRILKERSKCFIIGNGDAVDRETALKMKQETGCDAVMIGRAAIGNPFIFRQIADPAYEPSSKEMFETAIKHFEMLWDIAGPRAALEIRKYYKHYIKDFTGAADARRTLMAMTGRDEIIGYIKQLMN